MKRLLFIFPLIFFALASHCQGPAWHPYGVVIGDSAQVNSNIATIDSITVTESDTILYLSIGGVQYAVDLSFGGGGGAGTVTSVGLSLPSQLTVSGSPVTGNGTLTGAWADTLANYVFAGPASGGAAPPQFRALVLDDMPYSSGAAVTIDESGNLDLGGALDAPKTITGTETNFIDFRFITAGTSASRLYYDPTTDAFMIIGYENSDYTGDSARIYVDEDIAILESYSSGSSTSIKSDNGSLVVTDNVNGVGLVADADYSSSYTDRAFVDKEYSYKHIGGQNVSAEIYNPTPSDHGSVIIYDSTGNAAGTDHYQLQSVVDAAEAAGIVLCAFDTITYANEDKDTVVSLPVGAIVKEIEVLVITQFNGTGTDYLDVGISTDGDKFQNDLDLSVTDVFWNLNTNLSYRAPSTVYITHTYTDGNSDASAGIGLIYVYYMIPRQL